MSYTMKFGIANLALFASILLCNGVAGAAKQTCNVSPNCTPYTSGNLTYSIYHIGQYVTIADNNPGNTNPQETPVVNYINGDYTVCTAVTTCSEDAAQDAPPHSYRSWQLYYSQSSNAWICTQYYYANTNSSYFNVANSDALLVYGGST